MFSDLDRPALRPAALTSALVRDGSLWSEVRVLDEAASTNAVVAQLARADGREGLVVVAEWQTAGRGRLGRDWSTPPRAALTFSFLLRPRTPQETWAWLPLLTGVAVATATRDLAEIDARLKWPNDVLVNGRKLAGILAERVDSPSGPAVVVGIGLNVTTTREELPIETATSLRLEDAAMTDRDPLLRAILRGFSTGYEQWQAAAGDDARLRSSYRSLSATVGAQVRVLLPGERVLEGTATDVDDSGCLVVASAGGTEVLAAGDVVHVRPAAPSGP